MNHTSKKDCERTRNCQNPHQGQQSKAKLLTLVEWTCFARSFEVNILESQLIPTLSSIVQAVIESEELPGRRKLEAVPDDQLGGLQLGEFHDDILPVTATGRKYVNQFRYQVSVSEPFERSVGCS